MSWSQPNLGKVELGGKIFHSEEITCAKAQRSHRKAIEGVEKTF